MLKVLFALLTAGKLGQVLTSGFGMLVSLAAYALVFGWGYAAGLVFLILCHEAGHYLVARALGLRVSLPMLIPFFGAWVTLKDQPMNAVEEADIGFAGPATGTLAAIACLIVARLSEAPLPLALAYAGFIINLFNLLPLAPFDGGHIVAVVSPRLWLIGVPLMGAMFFLWPSPMLLIMAILAAPGVWRAWRFDPKAPENARYFDSTPAQKLEYGALYLALTIFLAGMSFELHEELSRLIGRGR